MTPPSAVLCHDDLNYEFEGPEGDWFRIRVRAYLAPGPVTIVVLTDYARQPYGGSPMDLRIAHIATDVQRTLGLIDREVIFVEHHDDTGDRLLMTIRVPERPNGQGFERVEFTEEGTRLNKPRRTFMSKAEVEALIGQPLAGLPDPS